MKKITLLFFMLLISMSSFAQFPEGFEGTWPPAGWTIINNGGPNVTWGQSQLGNSNQPAYEGQYAAFLDRENVATGLTEDLLVTPQFTVPASPQLKFFSRLSITGDSGGIYEIRITTDPDPLTAVYTTIQTWTETQINPAQTEYVEKVVSIPTSYIGQQVYIAFVMLADFDDRWLIDNVNVVEQCLDPTTLTASNMTQTTADLSWANPSGATSWEIEVVQAAATPNGSGVVYSGALPYTAPGLTEGTAYKYYVRAICAPGNVSQWVGPFNFSTMITGAVCSAPIIVNTLPYSATGNTSSYGDDFDGTPGATGCGTTGNFLNGNEVVYAYTATFTGAISVGMTGNGANSAMFVYNSCANIGVSCVAGGTGNATTPVNLPTVSVVAGTTYYIVISSSTTQTTAYNLLIQQVNCPPPTNLSVNNQNATSADLSWNANGATSWEIVVQTQGAGVPPGAGTTTTVNTNYNVTQTTAGVAFAPATAYEYYVRADCGAGDGTFSAWAGPFLFQTTQIPVALDYSEDFEGVTGWSLSNGTAVNKWFIGTAVNNGGTHSMYVSNDNGTSNAYTINTTSVVHAYRDIQLPATVGQVSLSFDWRAAGESTFDYIRVWSVPVSFVPTPGTQITALNSGGVQIGGNFNQSAAWTTTNQVIDMSASAGQVRRIIFEWRNDGSVGTQPPGAVDNVNISIITCSSPSALAVSGITQNSANATWTAPGSGADSYDYYVSTSATAPTDSTTPTGNVTTTTAALTGLNDSTSYNVWVRSNCGADGTSFWVGPIAFNTLCTAFDVPFFEGFNSDSTTEFCWTVINSNGDGDTWNMNYTTNPYEGNQVAMMYTDFNNGNNNDWLISPTINLTGNQRLRYRYRVQSSFEPNDFEVLLSTEGTDPVNFTTTVVPLATYSNTTYVEVIVNLQDTNGLITGPVNIAWHVPNGGLDGWRVYIDNVIVEDIPTCPDPTALAVSNVTDSSATLSWTAGLNETAWQVVVQPQGTGTPTTDVIPVTENPYTVTGLNPSTNYEFYVKAHCADDDQSNWVGPVNFLTTQIPGTLPFTEDFEDTVEMSLSNGTAVNQWEVGTATSNGGTHSLYISNDNGVNNAFTINSTSVVHAYRDLQFPATVGEVTLSFDWKAQGEGCCDYMRVWLVPSTFNPTPGTLITEGASGGVQIDGNFNLNGVWTSESYILQGSDYAGQIMRLVFEWRNDGSVGTQPPAAVDNISLIPVTCPSPINLIAEDGPVNTLILSWDPVGTETQWEIVTQLLTDGAPGDTPATSVIVNEPTYTVEVEAGILYEYYVRAICGPGDVSFWAGPSTYSIFNPPGCADVDIYDVDLEIIESDTEIVLCPEEDNCVPLSASYFETGETTEYTVESITYDPPYPFLGGTPLDITTDDIWGPVVDLPFDFCFFGENFDEAKVGSNGVVMFGENMADGGNCPWSYSQTVPNTAFPIKNAIYGVYQDILPNSSGDVSINYQVLGSYPCRALVVNFYEVPQFSCGTSVGTQTSQIVIYEISNIIEVYVEKRTPCTTWNGGRGVIGIQNSLGTEGYTPPGRNTGAWSATNEAWRFSPSGQTNVVFEWLKDGVFYSDQTDITVCVTDESVMTARATYTDCNGDEIVQDSEVTIRIAQPIDVEDPLDLEACSTGNDVTFDLTESLTDIYTVLDPAQYTFKFYATEADALAGADNNLPEIYTTNTSQTIYVRVFENGADDCGVVLSFELILSNTPPQFDITDDLTLCSDDTAIIVVTPINFDPNDATYTWTLDGTVLPDTGSSVTTTGPGVYQVTVNNGGCEAVETVNVTVSPSPNASIAYDNSPYCSDAGTATVTLSGSTGGTFSSSEGLVIDAVTGDIDLDASYEGTYQVTYYIAPTASCDEFTATAEVTITPAPNAEFTYDAATFCMNMTNTAAPTFNGGTGGTFTTDMAGLTIDPMTGIINPSTSAAGTYIVTNTIPAAGGCNGDTASVTVEIIEAPIGTFTYAMPAYCQEEANDATPILDDTAGTFSASPAGLAIDSASGAIDLSASQPGTYTVSNTIAATTECAEVVSTATVTISGTPGVVVIGGCEGNIYRLEVADVDNVLNPDNVTYAWTGPEGFTAGDVSFIEPVELGDYFVTITTPDGCSTVQAFNVESTSCLVQKGISPGDNGKNNTFDLTALNVTSLSIFNRYGQEVFSYGNYTNQWGGQDNSGNELPTGTYFYSFERANGETKTGWIYVNRQN